MGHGVRESNGGVGVECDAGSVGMAYPPKSISLTSFPSASAVRLFSTPQKALFINTSCVISNSN